MAEPPLPRRDFIDQQGGHEERLRKLETGVVSGSSDVGYDEVVYAEEDLFSPSLFNGSVTARRFGGSITLSTNGILDIDSDDFPDGFPLVQLPDGWAPSSQIVSVISITVPGVGDQPSIVRVEDDGMVYIGEPVDA